jgi:hypothetical protein
MAYKDGSPFKGVREKKDRTVLHKTDMSNVLNHYYNAFLEL